MAKKMNHPIGSDVRHSSVESLPVYSNSESPGYIREAIDKAKSRIAPLWDTRDYVAVNPLFGYRGDDFLDSITKVEAISRVLLLPEKVYLKSQYIGREIEDQDLTQALMLFQKRNPSRNIDDIDHDKLIQFLDEKNSSAVIEDQIRCLSDLYDDENGTRETNWITKEVSKWASAYFDEGQALWKMPGKDKRLLVAWKNLVRYEGESKAFDAKMTPLIKRLSNQPHKAIEQMLFMLVDHVTLDESQLIDYFARLFFTVQGWSSLLQKNEFERSLYGVGFDKDVSEMVDILAIRMAYDIAFLEDVIELESLAKWDLGNKVDENQINYSYIWLMAHEASVRRKISQKLNIHREKNEVHQRPIAQMAFCIDVRSEVIRRHLENHCDGLQTIGFAGFFGLPISVKKLGFTSGDIQCPVLIKPSLEVSESALDPKSVSNNRRNFAFEKMNRRNVQMSSNSSFSMAETFGFSYALKMLKNGLGLKKANIDFDHFGESGGESTFLDETKIEFATKVNFAYGALTNMGLTSNFSKYVFFFGHGGEASNNPYQSALDCGACAGHNGKYNSRLLAGLLNDDKVRESLVAKGIRIPKDTLFISGWHNTTRDLLLVDESQQVEIDSDEYKRLRDIMDRATQDCRIERSQFLSKAKGLSAQSLADELGKRSNDWSEIRQEWALARNHSFIVGRRQLTRKVNLDGRSFLHDYDESTDPYLKKLELIMTAPMIVTNWINMQYYASTIDPDKFGAGNKTMNNVVGTIGCIQGNESDLLGGLSEQSVRWNGKYFHEPLRLQVFIEAQMSSIDKIIEKHELVSQLALNGWLNIISISPETGELRLRLKKTWIDCKEGLWN